MFKITTLDSGLKVLTSTIGGTEAITTLVMCGAGSRYEDRNINGVAHFLEHMFFKGAKKYPDCKSVAEAIDSIGGEFNAFTDKEYVGYYITTPKEKYLTAFDVLSDMLLHSKFEEEEITRERGVILEEMNMYEDLLMQKVHEVFEEQVFGDNPLGWSVLGTKETVKSMTRNDFINYRKELYVPENMIISVVGAVNHEDVVKRVEEYFQFEDQKQNRDIYQFESFECKDKNKIYNKLTEQAHIVLGVPAVGAENFHKRYLLKMLSIILGGNMSSRMFMSVRERQGLCYYIRTSYSGYVGTGYFATSAGVDLKRVTQAIEAIKKEYKEIAKDGITEIELEKSKEYAKGKMTLGLEDSSSLAQFYAHQAVVYGEVKNLSEIKSEIDSITVEEINSLAKELFENEELYLSVIGPYDKNLKLQTSNNK